MNDLQYAGTDDGDTILYYPHAGHEFWFRKQDWQTVTLWKVGVVDGVEQQWDEETSLLDLPAPVRAVLRRNNLRYRESIDSVGGAMNA